MKPLLALALALTATAAAGAPAAGYRTAVLAGGCFWSVEHEVGRLPGVVDVVSGYAGGTKANPTYRDHAGYLEAVKVTYDPAKTSYAKLVDGFFHHIDPTDAGGQVCDRGPSYTTAVFTASPQERQAAQAVKAQVAKALGKPVATRVLPATTFTKAEAYHQDYAEKNPLNYRMYRIGCGRDAKIKAVWAGR